jgi:hypothetical protein
MIQAINKGCIACRIALRYTICHSLMFRGGGGWDCSEPVRAPNRENRRWQPIAVVAVKNPALF